MINDKNVGTRQAVRRDRGLRRHYFGATVPVRQSGSLRHTGTALLIAAITIALCETAAFFSISNSPMSSSRYPRIFSRSMSTATERAAARQQTCCTDTFPRTSGYDGPDRMTPRLPQALQSGVPDCSKPELPGFIALDTVAMNSGLVFPHRNNPNDRSQRMSSSYKADGR
jgi:hypothetical protein